MSRPGIDINVLETPPALQTNNDTGTLFAAAATERGPLTPVLLTSFNDWKRQFGGRLATSYGYDYIEAAFRSGVGRCYFSRVTGPTVVVAFKSLLNTATESLKASANGPGTWGNSVQVSVAAGILNAAARVVTFSLVTTDGSGTITETSPEALDRDTLVNWSQNTQLGRLVLGVNVGLPDVVAAGPLATGTDDIVNETDAQYAVALARFGLELGPGQVVAPGRTTSAAQQSIADHAAANRRVGLVDYVDTPTAATLTTAAALVRAFANARWVAGFAPWVTIPGVTGNTVRRIPYSAIQAGLIAQADKRVPPAVPAAGRQYGSSTYALGVTQAYTAAERSTLSDAGVNIARVIQGVVETYDYVSAASPATLPAWHTFGAARTAMRIEADASNIGESFFGRVIDGKRKTIKAFGGALEGVLKQLYEGDGLYGATDAAAYRVEVDQANTTLTIANQELHAQIAFRCSQFAQWVVIDIVNTPITQDV